MQKLSALALSLALVVLSGCSTCKPDTRIDVISDNTPLPREVAPGVIVVNATGAVGAIKPGTTVGYANKNSAWNVTVPIVQRSRLELLWFGHNLFGIGFDLPEGM